MAARGESLREQCGQSFVGQPALKRKNEMMLSVAGFDVFDQHLTEAGDYRPARLEIQDRPDVLHFVIHESPVGGFIKAATDGVGKLR